MAATRRSALITGSGQNIGRAVALALAADGFNIVVNGLTKRVPCEETAEAARAQGVEAIVVMGDVGTAEVLRALQGVAPVRAVLGNVDDPRVVGRHPLRRVEDVGGVRVLVTHRIGRPAARIANTDS